MPPALPSWPRPHFVPGGGDAFVLYACYGTLDLTTPLDRATYHAAGVPAGFDLSLYDRYDQATGFAHFSKGHAWQLAAAEQPELAVAAKSAQHMALFRGYANDPATLDYFRDGVGIVAYLLDRGAVAVYDPQCFQLISPQTWRTTAVAPGGPAPHAHVVILETPEAAGTIWFHTRGMRKFGRPDVSVRGVIESQRTGVIELCNRFIEWQALGGVVTAEKPVKMAALPNGAVCTPGGALDDPEFNNFHVAVTLN